VGVRAKRCVDRVAVRLRTSQHLSLHGFRLETNPLLVHFLRLLGRAPLDEVAKLVLGQLVEPLPGAAFDEALEPRLALGSAASRAACCSA
jgi:hypothetical protein